MKKRISESNITELNENEIFVFGSNSSGEHWGGAAKLAHEKFGAVWGISDGISGNTYAIDSMSGMGILKDGIGRFMETAKKSKNSKFLVTEIGCGIAGFKIENVAPLFDLCINIENVYLPARFWEFYKKGKL